MRRSRPRSSFFILHSSFLFFRLGGRGMTAAVFSLTFTGEPRTSLSLGEREVTGGEPLVVWGDAAHFDGARGRVWVRLASRPAGAGGLWQDRALLPVYVMPSKLSEARYEGMVAELRSLAAGLVFDLVSKSLRALGLGRG